MITITVNTSEYETVHFAYFAKPKGLTAVNQLKDSLNISPIQISGYTDHDNQDIYFKRIGNIVGNPKIESQMRLPVSVFQRFKFDKLIYLNVERLTGYFFVDSIVNYVDGKTNVDVNLYMI